MVAILLSAQAAAAADRYALIVTGASGGPEYAQKYDGWRVEFVNTLKEKFGYLPDHLLVLAEEESAGIQKSTRENVRGVKPESFAVTS